MEERQNRRAKGTSAGEKRCDDERSRSELARFSPATGDRGSPVVLPVIISIARQARQCSLCVSASLRYILGWAAFVSFWLLRGWEGAPYVLRRPYKKGREI